MRSSQLDDPGDPDAREAIADAGPDDAGLLAVAGNIASSPLR